jgi:hypothetical protein
LLGRWTHRAPTIKRRKEAINKNKMEKEGKKVYVPPHVPVRQVISEGSIAAPVSAIITEESIK